jgi:phenylacetate-CoA ligase
MIYNKKMETIAPDELEQLQLERLQATLNRACRNVASYKRAVEERKIDIEKIRSLSNLREFPFTTKDDLRAAYPYGMFAVPLRDIVRIHASSGTTGKPIVIGYTKNDIDRWTSLMARSLTAAGLTAHDVVQVAFNYSLFTGGLGFHYGAEKIEASVIPTSSGGNLAEQVLLMKDFKTTALVTTPSYGLALANLFHSMDIPSAELFLKAGIFGAEPWSETVRTQIEEKLHITAYDCYGVSEIMGPGVACECEQKNGLHINEDHFIVEVINPVTLDLAPDGQEGELVFTTITKEGFPLIRYRTGDLARILEGPCACGRTLRRMSRVMGRTDDQIAFQGIKVFPSQIQEIALSFEGIAPNMRIVLDRKDDADTLEVQICVQDDAGFIDEIRKLEQLRTDIQRRLETDLGVSPRVIFVEPATLAVKEHEKNLRVIDKRTL